MKATSEKILLARVTLLGAGPHKAAGPGPMALTGHVPRPRSKSRLRQASLPLRTSVATGPLAPPAGRSATPILRPAARLCVNTAQSKPSAPPILPSEAGNLSSAAENLRSAPPGEVHDPAILLPAPAADRSLAAADHSPAAADACLPASGPRSGSAVAKFPSATLNSTSAIQSPVTTHAR